MKITIKNFGPIAEFHFDLDKDIIVTYGDNNIGKSYAMQMIYLFLKNLLDYASHYTRYYRYSYTEPYSEEIGNIVSVFANGADESTDITNVINNALLTDLTEGFLMPLCASCENTFGYFDEVRKQTPLIELQFSSLNILFSLGVKLSSDGSIYRHATMLKRSSSGFHKSRNANSHLDIFILIIFKPRRAWSSLL